MKQQSKGLLTKRFSISTKGPSTIDSYTDKLKPVIAQQSICSKFNGNDRERYFYYRMNQI